MKDSLFIRDGMKIMAQARNSPFSFKLLSLFIILFSFATVFSGGKALFSEAGRTAAGEIVPYVLWYNFIAGFFYFVAGVAILKQHSCAKKVSSVLALTSSVVLIFLGVHILSGKAYETRTLVAMMFRSVFWVVVALTLFKAKYLKSPV